MASFKKIKLGEVGDASRVLEGRYKKISQRCLPSIGTKGIFDGE